LKKKLKKFLQKYKIFYNIIAEKRKKKVTINGKTTLKIKLNRGKMLKKVIFCG